jgi:hypothetical protein
LCVIRRVGLALRGKSARGNARHFAGRLSSGDAFGDLVGLALVAVADAADRELGLDTQTAHRSGRVLRAH